MKYKQAFVAIMLLLFLCTPVSAITAGELLKESDSKVVSRYLMGLVDMMSYMEYVKGNNSRGKCIYDWYYNTENSIEKVYSYLERYPDKFPESILIVLAKRPCPE